MSLLLLFNPTVWGEPNPCPTLTAETAGTLTAGTLTAGTLTAATQAAGTLTLTPLNPCGE